jgi:hypothetical protein
MEEQENEKVLDQDKDKKLAEIEATLEDIHKILKPSRWEMFVQGLWRAAGYLVGLGLTILIIGWILNIMGLIPFLKDFSESMREILNIARTK